MHRCAAGANLSVSARRELIAQHAVPLEVDNRAAERPRAVFGTGVDTDAPFELGRVLRLMDVPVEPEQRLGLEDCIPKGRAAYRYENLLAALGQRPWRVRRGVELWCDV